MSAKSKIGRVAEVFDPLKHSMAGFQSQSLTPTEFREQLRRNFRITLTDAELGAVVRLFDKDGDETIDSVEFINEFFKLGKEERKKIGLKSKQRADMVKSLMDKIQDRKEAQFARLQAIYIATSFSDDNMESALAKIRKVAFSFIRVRGFLNEGHSVLDSFKEPLYLTPYQFREQMKRSFDLVFTPGESAALVQYFDDDGNGVIDAKEFLVNFFALRRMEIDEHFRMHQASTNRRHRAEEVRLLDRKFKYNNFTEAKLTEPTEKDKKSALQKIRLAAAFHRPNVFINAIEKSFEASDLTPTQFKEMMKNNFEIYLSPGELAAAVDHFDDDKDGQISSAEFTHHFYKLGAIEHSNRLDTKRRKEFQYAEDNKRMEEEKKAAYLAQCATKVIWPDLPPEEDEDFDLDGISEAIELATKASSNDLSIDGTITSSDMQSVSTSATNGKKKKNTRKSTMGALLNPDKMIVQLARSNKSLVPLYPKASEDTKMFILALEEQERGLERSLRSSKKSKLPYVKRKSKSQVQAQTTNYDDTFVTYSGEDYEGDTHRTDSPDDMFDTNDYGEDPFESKTKGFTDDTRPSTSRSNNSTGELDVKNM